MPLPKGFGSVGDTVNKHGQEGAYLFSGILGALIVLYGLTQSQAHLYYVVGASFMLATAIFFKLTYFVALEMILIAGHGAVLLGIGAVSQAFLPILLCLQLLFYYLLSGQLTNIFRIIGILGIALLSIAFSYDDVWVFFFGSLAVTIFSFYQVYRGRLVALLWAVLNTVFVFFSLFKLIL